MRSLPKDIRIYGERSNGQWTLVCLDFSLAVQDETLSAAKSKLGRQIESYVKEATEGIDSKHRDYLLSRGAPLHYWAKFYVFYAYKTVLAILDGPKNMGTHIASKRPMSDMLSTA